MEEKNLRLLNSPVTRFLSLSIPFGASVTPYPSPEGATVVGPGAAPVSATAF